MLCNIVCHPKIFTSNESIPSLRLDELCLILKDHFSCVELVTEYAVRFRQGNTQGVIFDTGYAEITSPQDDIEVFLKCAELLFNIVFFNAVVLRGFDAFCGKTNDRTPSYELYKDMAAGMNMDWKISRRPLGLFFSARTKGMEEVYDRG